MAAPIMNTVLRSILTSDLEMPAAEVVKKARALGVKQPDATIKHNIYNLRSSMRNPKPTSAQPAVARTTPATKTVASKPIAKPAGSNAPAIPSTDLNGVFANVALVNKVVAISGGVDQARQVAEAVRACGSVEVFLQHLDLVAGVRASVAPNA